jgi:tetratricopeptide (TPR) repeat protein/HEAT repeat protein
VAIAAGLAGAGAAGVARAQDFDPHGHHHARPPTPHPIAPFGPHTPAPPAGTPPTTAAAPALIERYTRVVLSQPGAPFPLQRLAQLYRERDGDTAKLVADFEARAAVAGPDQYAALVGLAGLYKVDGRADDAIATYGKAIERKPQDATAILALARLHGDRGDFAPARENYERGLALQSAKPDREQTLRTLVGLALDAKDWDAATRFHRELVKLEPTNLFVRGELGRELFRRAEYSRAEAELEDVVAGASGDNRALAPALKELGAAQAKAMDGQAALTTLSRALAVAGAQSALRAEIYQIIAEIYRAEQRLPALVHQLEAEHPGDYARLAMLGGLYEETGDTAKAIETYRRALALAPREVDLRLRMIRLLQADGDLDRAIAEYEGLIRAAPDNPQFVFEECEALMQRGDHARALRLVTELEARAAGDEDVLSRVAEFYAKVGENDRSLKVLQRLAQTSTSDPAHLVDLGDRYFQAGNVPLAMQTWKRIVQVVQPRARALAALGDVYLEHDKTSDALAAYREAAELEPSNLTYEKALAAALERTHGYREARGLYEDLMRKARDKGDRGLLRECRTRVVTLWSLERTLEQQVTPLTRQFGASPPDVEAGRTLAEVYSHLRRLSDAEATLQRVIALAPGDAESYGGLERTLVQEGKIAEAIAVLERLAQLEPMRAREIYQRMAQYALQIYKDADAIRYAARAVELDPDDAEGHRRLGEMYRSKQDVEHAIAEFRAAITKNDRLYVVYFELADLLLSKGQADDADRLFRRVLRGAPDEELVARATRLSMQINIGKGTLESLEQDLLPVAIGNPQRPIYRRLLVEIYGSLAFGLMQRVRHGSPEDAATARATLARIGGRAVKPLLDALADPDVGQQRIAIDVLAYVQSKSAALPLYAFATGDADPALRARAMIACGALGDASLVPKLQALLFPDGGDQGGLGDAVAVAAPWGLARLRNPRAVLVLRRVAASGTPAMRALAVLGLGIARDQASVASIADLARADDASNVVRAAAAYALGDLDATSRASTLIELAEDGDELPRRMALGALARMATSGAKAPAWAGEAVDAMADAVFTARHDSARGKAAGSLARTAVSALACMAARSTGRPGAASSGETLPVPEGSLDVDALLDALAPGDPSDEERSAALVQFAVPIQRAALAALSTSGDRARAVLDALGLGDGELLPFVGAGPTGGSAAAQEKARAIARALEPSIVPLARHPDPAVRARAIGLVAHSSSDGAVDAIDAALEDSDEAVQRVALAAVGATGPGKGPVAAGPRAVSLVARVLAGSEAWPMRVLAAGALGRLGASGAAGAVGAAAEARQRLTDAATTDSYAFVREAALDALSTFDRPAAVALARRMAAGDPEPRVREAAAALAQ